MLKTSNDQRKLLPNFEQLFATTAQAPGGVARLRELILTLAVQGKLVPQDPSDEPASELLKKIRAEKDRLIAEGKIKKDKPLPAITEEEKPFELPVGWEWVRLPGIYYSISPSGNKLLSSAMKAEGQYPVIDQGQKIVAGYTDDYSLLINIPGPVIIFGDHTKAIKYIEFNFVAGADGTKILRPVFQDEKFFTFQLKSFNLEDRGYARHFKVLNTQLYALPPLAEQSRIVTRVEELMRLCDVLEEKGRLEHTQHQQLLQAMLDSLTQTTDAQELARHWQRLAQHFDLLIDRPEAVDALEQTILQLAVRGLLVPQDPGDEPASELLKKIRAEKDRLIAEGKIKKDKPLPAIGENEKPFELPVGWEWVRLGALGDWGAGATPLRSNSSYYGGSIPWFKSGELVADYISDSEETVTEMALRECSLRLNQVGDVLVAMYGATIGKTAILSVAGTTNQAVCACTPFTGLQNTYLLLLLKALKPYFISIGAGGAQPNISREKIVATVIGLPPLAEQSRIVACVTELRALCQQLREKLTQARTTQTQLAQAWVEQVAG